MSNYNKQQPLIFYNLDIIGCFKNIQDVNKIYNKLDY